MSTVAIIPARGGSKRVPRKNVLPFADRPLIAWTIQAAIAAGLDRVIVSTDCPEIAAVSKQYGAEVVIRPDDLAGDNADTLSAIRHAIEGVRATTLVLLQPTSPLRASKDIVNAVRLHAESGRPVVSVSDTAPWLYWLEGDGLEKITNPSQAQPVQLNGAVYVCSTERIRAGKDWWESPIAYKMPPERSVDIDTQADFDMAEALARKNATKTGSREDMVPA